MSQGVYEIPKVEFNALSVATNTTSTGAYRGAGRPEATAMLERIMDMAADELGLDPVAIRRRNLIPAGEFPFETVTGVTYDSGDYDAALTEALRVAGYEELRAEQAARRERGDVVQLGIGVATYVEITAPGQTTEFAEVAVDPELGLVYFGTGNPGPDYNGSVRRGDNLFSTSIVAIDANTGKYRWHFQQVHHDIWDFDAASPPLLFDLTIDGKPRKGIAEASKTGWVYVLDRVTGEPLIGIDEKPVLQEPRQATAATQPHPRGDAFVPQEIPIAPEGTTLVNRGRIFTPFWTTPVLAKPGPPGGVNWPPSSYDPEAGLIYVCAADRIWSFFAQEIGPERPTEGATYIAGGIGGVHGHALGVFAALDVRSNELVWQQQWAEPCYSGSVATAGGLVFVGRNDGRLTALDSSNGMKLWEFQTGAGMNAPASTFEHNGKQYVAAYSAGNVFAGSSRGDSLWLFAVDGTLEPVPAASALMSFAPGTTTPGNAESGVAVYTTACVACHGEQGEGGHGGGPSLQALKNAAVVLQVVSEGRNAMPSFNGTLTAEQIRDVAAFVSGRLAK
jgi:alcohol dehydrogenase (cytochrome c)